MRRDDQIRLRHMLDAAREAIAFTRGRTRDDLEEGRMLALALVKGVGSSRLWLSSWNASRLGTWTNWTMPGGDEWEATRLSADFLPGDRGYCRVRVVAMMCTWLTPCAHKLLRCEHVGLLNQTCLLAQAVGQAWRMP